MTTSESAPPRTREHWFAGLGLLLLAAATLLLLRPALQAPLMLDDAKSVDQVRGFEHWTECFGPDVFQLYRPVKNLFFYAVEQAGGSLACYHSITAAGLLLAMVGVYVLALRLTRQPLWSLLAAGLWVVTAPNATLGSWASCFNISIAAAAMTFGLAAWDRWREEPRRWGQAVTFAIALIVGLLSYETAVSIAPLAVMLDLYRGRRIFAGRSIGRYAAIAVVVVAWLTLRHTMGAKTDSIANPSMPADLESWKITASAPYFLWTHFLMWAAPWGRLECLGSYLWDRSVPAAILPFCWMLLLGCIALGFRFWRPGNLFVFGLAWFLLAAIPSGNFLPIGNTPYADYYVPLPAIGLSLALMAAIRQAVGACRETSVAPAARRVLWSTVVIMLGWRVAAVSAFHDWSTAWSDASLVMARTAAARPYQYLAKSFLADAMLVSNQLETAEFYARSADHDAPQFGAALSVLAEIALIRGDKETALELDQEALRRQHFNTDTLYRAHFRVAQLISDDPDRVDEAFAHYLPLLQNRKSKYHKPAILGAAEMFRSHGLIEKQLETLEKGVGYHPDDPDLREALEQAQHPTATAAREAP